MLKLKKMILAAGVLVATLLFSAGSSKTMADDPEWSTIEELGVYDEDHSLYYDITIGENGTIVFITDDARRTSPIYYHTAGFTFYRCYPGTQEPDLSTYIIIMLPDPTFENYYTAPDGRTRVRAVWHFDYNTQILNPIMEKSEEWYREVITQEQETWLYADGIMQVCFDDNRDGRADRYSGELCVGQQPFYYGPIYGFDTEHDIGLSGEGEIYSYGTVYRSADELRAAQPWGSGTDGMDTHFGKRIRLVPDRVVPPAEELTNIVDILGDHDPEYVTWNRSTTGEYDLAEGIPSSEGITNSIVCDDFAAWYTTIGRRVTNRYRVVYNITFKYTAVGHNRDGTEYTYDTYITATKYYDIDRTAVYYYIVDLNVYDWTDATVYNDALPDGYAYYQSNHTPEVTAVVSGVDMTTNNMRLSTHTYSEEELDANHVVFPEGTGSTISVTLDYTQAAKGRTYTMSEAETVLNSLDFQSQAQSSVGQVRAHNDTLIINGVTYLDGTEKSGNVQVQCTPGERIPDELPEEYDSGVAFEGTPYSRDMIIPDETQNGEYPTYMTVNYTEIAPASGSTWTLTCAQSDPRHITDEGTPAQETQEPVVVHTPVISPVHVTHDGREDIQLIHPDLDVMYQFILDGTYTFTFDPAMHNDIQGYGWSGDPSKFDEYVKSKEVKFPFEVRIGSDWYEPDEWITVGNETTFYIPPWAIEGTYTIEYKVTAMNYTGTGGSQDTANTDRNNYIATYNLTCQVSGQIYDFQVTGLNDKDIFGGFEETYEASQDWSFVLNDEAKRVGANNRLGESYIRLSDGTVVSSWNTSNILPFSVGSSNTLTGMGSLRTGTTFCFTVKTIANLWGENDSIYITPSYRYVDMDGNVRDDVTIYYYDHLTGDQYVEVGSERDRARLHEGEYIDSIKFRGSYKQSDLEYTVSLLEWVNGVNPIYNYRFGSDAMFNQSEIRIPSSKRMFIGGEEELAMNLHKNRDEIGTLVIPDGKEDIFHQSMQLWFGTFTIPSDFYVCDSDIDINEYALTSEEGLSDSSSIWLKDGYLILSFDIISLKDWQEHLSYINLDNNVAYGHCNMWRREGGATTAILEGDRWDETFRIDVQDGDIAAIYMNRHIYDKYRASYLFSE